MSTAYTSLLRVAPAPAGVSGHSSQEKRPRQREQPKKEVFLVQYDRLANGWASPPGPWGVLDMVFSLRFSMQP